MPSPVGHSLIGLAIGLAYYLPRGITWRGVIPAIYKYRLPIFLAFFFALSPDLDLLPGFFVGELNRYHHLYTHTLGWVLIIALIAWVVWRSSSKIGWREFAFVFLLGASHLFADWLCEDTHPPYGIMAFWPITDTYYISNLQLFGGLKKQTLQELFTTWSNIGVVANEALWTIMPVVAVLLFKRYSLPSAVESAQVLDPEKAD